MTDKEKYNTVSSQLDDIENELEKLENSELINRYKKLINEKELLLKQKKELYKVLKKEEYKKCHHLLITTYVVSSHISNDRDICFCGCLKCGLDESIKVPKYEFADNKMTFDYQIMYDYLISLNMVKKNVTNVICDLDLARSIYNKILEHNPKINDMLAVKYLEIALDNIRNIKMTNERKESRIKRLELKNDFNNWKKEDVIKKF